jgi:hypothetical protein
MKMNDYERRWCNQARKWIYRHREVVEEFIGRELMSIEHVHHKDGNPRNNVLENLEVLTCAEHARVHKHALKNRLCGVIGCDSRHHSKGYCKKHYARVFRKKQGW